MQLLQDFKDNWLKKHFVPSGQKVLLATSGGADSMVMAHLCLSTGVSFGIAHCNFQLRGTESDLDESLVRDWAVRNGISFHHTRFETKQRMNEWKKGVQETARILRYEWLDMICKEHGYSFLATAHHASDNVETLLMNLFKGTGIAGLHGIPERNGNVIRPLLFATKDSVLEYARDHNVPYRDDASNSTDVYQRNAIRNKIIPAIAEFFPGVSGHINDSISRFAQAETLYKEAVAQHIKKLMEKRGQDYYIPVLKLKKEAVPETICYEMFSPYGFSAAQLPHIMQLMDAETGRYISSDTHRIIRNRNFLILTTSPAGATDLVVIEGAPCEVNVGSRHFTFAIEDKPAVIPADQNVAYLDMKNIEFPVLLRKWKLGDYFYPFGMGMKKKKISRYLIDQKVPLHKKEHVWLLECNKRIAWLAGMRPDERFKVKESTGKVLVCRLTALSAG
jgi:tRNA(Ile)-lysidine synthase